MAKKRNGVRPERYDHPILKEIEEAKEELKMAEEAFQWAESDTGQIDAAIARLEAAMLRYNFLIRRAKEMKIIKKCLIEYLKDVNLLI